jgi:hypothetical protein
MWRAGVVGPRGLLETTTELVYEPLGACATKQLHVIDVDVMLTGDKDLHHHDIFELIAYVSNSVAHMMEKIRHNKFMLVFLEV